MFYNKILAYFGVPAILLILIGLILFIYSIVKRKDTLFNYSALSVVVGFAMTLTIIIIPSYNDEDVSNGSNWSKCKIVEENAFNGSFSENVNKLNCNGTVKNISVSTYQKSLYAFEEQQTNGK
ncbi:hypothetical protein [Hafnia paralvei]|uniref:hypothetical protein n=1 Tax=Hafnia paralvei TaxID=546367 RepID=UPI0007E4B250|nr:hypothetical protein [Hafnia paralvei]